MPYISQGNIQESRSIWRASIVQDTFWGIINFVVLFFRTMFSPDMTKKGISQSTDYRRPGGGPPRPPGRRMGRVGGGGGGPSPPPMAGGG
ncbi:selenoprotein K-like [Xenia sp. Carnegie-2017]|uniref:selenoprotein K-like n=1 Tax=Xenia sp. Carnegie-2017 TaxID=2897299 RepID=UPI001F048FF2|nr:selenoprotein K-like [Xenia sp. Carnegie-2017]